MPPYVLGYDGGIGQVGGKAARLGAACAAGLRVPPGRVITADAHTAFLRALGLGPVLRDRRDRIEHDLTPPLEELEAELAGRRALWRLPDEHREALDRALEEVGDGPWILRSSAIAEDRREASLAGTYLSAGPVSTPEEAGEALLDVWAHAMGAPVLLALLEADLDPAASAVPVLVQPHLTLRRFAVVFSVDPAGTRGPRIEAVDGGGAELMAGSLAPSALLDPPRRRAVEDLEARCRELVGGPVDCELGWTGTDPADVVLLQARPQIIPAFQRPEARWSRQLTAERYPLPLTPLGFTNIEKVFDAAIRNFLGFLGVPPDEDVPVACEMDGLIWANDAVFERARAVRPRPPPGQALAAIGEVAGLLLRRGRWLQDLREVRAVLAGGGLQVWNQAPPDSFLVAAGLRTARRFLADAEARWLGDWPSTLARFQRKVAELEASIDPEAPTPQMRALERALTKETIEFLRPDLVIFALKEASLTLLAAVLAKAGHKVPLGELVAALGVMPENPTTAWTRELWGLAQERDADDFAARRADVLERFGTLSPSWEIRDPLLGDDPSVLDELLANLEGSPEPPARQGPGGPAARALRAQVQPYAELVAAFDELTERLGRYMQMDEEHRLYTSRVLRPTRTIVRLLGERLAEQGVLESWDDIHFLQDQEVWRILMSDTPRPRRLLPRQRRRRYESRLSWCQEVAPTSTARVLWRAQGASRGAAQGPARRVATLADAAAFQAGEVLVVRTPDPTWAMLYPLAAALVAETGGLLSHGVVAAREHGVPAVIGANGAFESLADGLVVTVDGATGEVRVQEQPEPAAAGDEPAGARQG